MTFWDFAAAHPVLTVALALIAGATIEGVAKGIGRGCGGVKGAAANRRNARPEARGMRTGHDEEEPR